MLPFEFIVEGTPVSHQTKNRLLLQDWKNKVRTEAQNAWPAGKAPVTKQVRIQIVYYYEGTSLDVDNMTKPIQDALNHLVYVDDSQVSDSNVAKRSLNGSFKVRGMSYVLAKGFCSGNEFVYIRVEEASNQEELL